MPRDSDSNRYSTKMQPKIRLPVPILPFLVPTILWSSPFVVAEIENLPTLASEEREYKFKV